MIEFQVQIIETFQGWFGCPALDYLFLALSALVEWPIITILIVGSFISDPKNPRTLRLLGIVGITLAVNLGLKELFGVHRPFHDHIWLLRGAAENGYSFPSGHSQMAAALWLWLFRENAQSVFDLFFVLALIFGVGVSRVYFGVHYPTDVICGWGIGLTTVMVWDHVCIAVENWRYSRRA